MAQVFRDLSHALTRSVRAQTTDILDGNLVAYGTAEDQVIKCSAANSAFTGVACGSAQVNKTLMIAEKNAFVVGVAGKAIAIGKRLYMTATGQKLTDTKPVAAGTYVSVGVSKSVAAADGDDITYLLDPQEVVVV